MRLTENDPPCDWPDLTPANVRVDSLGNVRVSDFHQAHPLHGITIGAVTTRGVVHVWIAADGTGGVSQAGENVADLCDWAHNHAADTWHHLYDPAGAA